jgi:putative endonuclease
MYYTYVLWSRKDKKFYIGYTADINRRAEEHLHGVSHTTSRMSDPVLIFFEAFTSETDARRRESYFKTTKGKKALRLIVRDSIKTDG